MFYCDDLENICNVIEKRAFSLDKSKHPISVFVYLQDCNNQVLESNHIYNKELCSIEYQNEFGDIQYACTYDYFPTLFKNSNYILTNINCNIHSEIFQQGCECIIKDDNFIENIENITAKDCLLYHLNYKECTNLDINKLLQHGLDYIFQIIQILDLFLFLFIITMIFFNCIYDNIYFYNYFYNN